MLRYIFSRYIMPENLTNQDLVDIDLSRIAALQQKRSLAFVNHFIITSAQFLNTFMKNCEHKLMTFERKLEKVNASLVLLEAKLSSIPEANILSETEAQEVQKESNSNQKPIETQIQNTESLQTSYHNTAIEDNNAKEGNMVKEELNPEYDRFVKMVQVGVPLEAVKLKVALEQLDPNVLEKILGK